MKIPNTLPTDLIVRYGFASNKITFPAGTPIIPCTSKPYNDDPADHIVAWIVHDNIELTELQLQWGENYGFPVYRDQLEPLTQLRKAARTRRAPCEDI
jgi:hypothetical protein